MKDTKHSINCKGKLINFDTPKVMGIVNITPDSFFEGSRKETEKDILSCVEKHLSEGATFIDLGAYSSRPNAKHISNKEEENRIIPALKNIVKHFPEAIISIDTFRSKIAEKCLNEGASIINDISAGNLDNEMFSVVKNFQAPYIIMHMKGTPKNMQDNPFYDNVSNEVILFLSKKINVLNKLGINDVIIDPGFGFGKTIEHNFELLKNLNQFSVLNTLILAGLSRKSMIWKTLKNSPNEALNGTTALHMTALMNGAKLLRVHDVKEATECIQLFNKMA